MNMQIFKKKRERERDKNGTKIFDAIDYFHVFNNLKRRLSYSRKYSFFLWLHKISNSFYLKRENYYIVLFHFILSSFLTTKNVPVYGFDDDFCSMYI